MAYTNRGSVYGNRDDLDRAIADFDRAIELDPTYARSYLVRGISHFQAGNADRAIDDWRELLRISNDPALREQAENLLREVGANE
jgi:tetratricopeptide (TPR) repeat protein